MKLSMPIDKKSLKTFQSYGHRMVAFHMPCGCKTEVRITKKVRVTTLIDTLNKLNYNDPAERDQVFTQRNGFSTFDKTHNAKAMADMVACATGLCSRSHSKDDTMPTTDDMTVPTDVPQFVKIYGTVLTSFYKDAVGVMFINVGNTEEDDKQVAFELLYPTAADKILSVLKAFRPHTQKVEWLRQSLAPHVNTTSYWGVKDIDTLHVILSEGYTQKLDLENASVFTAVKDKAGEAGVNKEQDDDTQVRVATVSPNTCGVPGYFSGTVAFKGIKNLNLVNVKRDTLAAVIQATRLLTDSYYSTVSEWIGRAITQTDCVHQELFEEFLGYAKTHLAKNPPKEALGIALTQAFAGVSQEVGVPYHDQPTRVQPIKSIGEAESRLTDSTPVVLDKPEEDEWPEASYVPSISTRVIVRAVAPNRYRVTFRGRGKKGVQYVNFTCEDQMKAFVWAAQELSADEHRTLMTPVFNGIWRGQPEDHEGFIDAFLVRCRDMGIRFKYKPKPGTQPQADAPEPVSPPPKGLQRILLTTERNSKSSQITGLYRVTPRLRPTMLIKFASGEQAKAFARAMQALPPKTYADKIKTMMADIADASYDIHAGIINKFLVDCAMAGIDHGYEGAPAPAVVETLLKVEVEDDLSSMASLAKSWVDKTPHASGTTSVAVPAPEPTPQEPDENDGELDTGIYESVDMTMSSGLKVSWCRTPGHMYGDMVFTHEGKSYTVQAHTYDEMVTLARNTNWQILQASKKDLLFTALANVTGDEQSIKKL